MKNSYSISRKIRKTVLLLSMAGLIFYCGKPQAQNVGITDAASITPNYLLHVYKNAASGPLFQLTNTTTGTLSTDGFIADIDIALKVMFKNQEAGTMAFFTNGTERITILSTGQVGISKTIPAYPLDVVGDVNYTGALRIGGAAGTTGQILLSAGGAANTWLASGIIGQILISQGAAAPTWVTGGVLSGGTANYLARWTGATTLSIGVTQDNNSTVGINVAPSASYNLYVSGALLTAGNATIYGASTGAAQVYGVLGTASAAVASASGVRGYASGATTATNGVWGESASSTGTGVYGLATNATGDGVLGWNNALAGASNGFGVWGITAQNAGFGVAGSNTNATGTGVLGAGNNIAGSYLINGSGGAFSSTNVGVYGYGNNTPGSYGVYGVSDNATGVGVYGWNNAAAGIAIGFGGWFTSNQTGGAALVGTLGLNSYFAGAAVSGITTSTVAGGRGGVFKCDNATGVGVAGQTAGASGMGVSGYNASTATSGFVIGLTGQANETAAGAQHCGVYGYATGGTSNFGLYSDAAIGVGEYGFDFGGGAGSWNDAPIGDAGFARLTNAGAITLTGIAAGYDGRILYLYYAPTATALTIANQSASSLAANRIITNTGANLVGAAAGGATATLIYSAGVSRWIVISWLP